MNTLVFSTTCLSYNCGWRWIIKKKLETLAIFVVAFRSFGFTKSLIFVLAHYLCAITLLIVAVTLVLSTEGNFLNFFFLVFLIASILYLLRRGTSDVSRLMFFIYLSLIMLAFPTLFLVLT
jgi:hypothetical protein